MNTKSTVSKSLLAAVEQERPLQIVGVINAYCALLAEHAGFKALYLSGAGVANASYGLPDLGLTTLDNVLEDVRRITTVSKLPLLVDADTGFGDPAETTRLLISAGAAGLHLEDQISDKRCGHRPNKRLVPLDEMVARIREAVNAAQGTDFVVMARSDAIAVEGFDAAMLRIQAYIDAGAQMIFPEAVSCLEDYVSIAHQVKVPILANITEFGKTPLFTRDQLAEANIAIALYPLTAFRMLSAAALDAYETLRQSGTQASLIERMQTRQQLYEHLDYHRYEQALDERLAKDESEK